MFSDDIQSDNLNMCHATFVCLVCSDSPDRGCMHLRAFKLRSSFDLASAEAMSSAPAPKLKAKASTKPGAAVSRLGHATVAPHEQLQYNTVYRYLPNRLIDIRI